MTLVPVSMATTSSPASPEGRDAAQVEGEGHALVVPRLAAGDVGHDRGPVGAERAEQRLQRRQVPAHLLDRDDVEARDDLRDAAHVEQIADRLVVLLGPPLLGEPTERAEIPGAYEEIPVELLGRYRNVERGTEREELLGQRSRKWIGDAGRGPTVLALVSGGLDHDGRRRAPRGPVKDRLDVVPRPDRAR